ncbi:craniofacial development protein 2 [Trichonephila clavipes]|nr:craniofacial development protein 2 [Trichonephila clavipes]
MGKKLTCLRILEQAGQPHPCPNPLRNHRREKIPTEVDEAKMRVTNPQNWLEHRTLDQKVRVRYPMPPNTLRVHTEYVLVKSVGSKVFWAVTAETTGAGGWRIFLSPPVPCLNCGGGDRGCLHLSKLEGWELDKKDYTLYFSGQEKAHHFGVGFIGNKRLRNAVIDFQAISRRLLRGRHYNATLICAHAPTDDKDETEKDLFYDLLMKSYNSCPAQDMKLVIGDFNAKIGR